ncbi:MAG: R3H domain-containing nucleic acid-binding protein [Capsulimonas sp.]|uniref:R3H domain-containing nucleic acid-binding protein n=1 Tax=Capsulimonas sp. TaxID=2494211 RepID=UPI00326563DB
MDDRQSSQIFPGDTPDNDGLEGRNGGSMTAFGQNGHAIGTSVTVPPLSANQLRVTDNLGQLLEVLPPPLRAVLEHEETVEGLIEIVLDLGRDAEARFSDGRVVWLREGIPVTNEDIAFVTARVGAFGKDNRAGIERTLHRISAIRNRQGKIIGLTCRIGRAVFGTIDIIRDIVESGKSILMLGRPGRGKTTKLREVARVLSDEFGKRVIIVDTSNEIAGDGDIPHPAIGRARRMQVATPEDQHGVMIEAVENHMPEVVVIDEIGVEQEAFAARTIAERGVQLIGTAHGNSLENLLMNPTLSDMVGGIQAVTLSDEEAKKRGTQKTVLERKSPPTFDVIIEIMEVDKLAIHHDVMRTVDKMLRGGQPRPEIRVRNANGQVDIIQKSDIEAQREPVERTGSLFEDHGHGSNSGGGGAREGSRIAPPAADGGPAAPTLSNGKALPATVTIFPYGVSRSRLERAIRTLRVPAFIGNNVKDGDVIIALKANYRKEPAKLQEGISRNIPTYVIKSNTYVQIENVLREIFRMPIEISEEDMAVQLAEEAIEEIINDESGGLNSLELAPQGPFLRRLQHQTAENYKMLSESIGAEPNRRVRISRP